MKALLDTDLLLDVALHRAEFFADSADVLRWAEANPGQAAAALAFGARCIVTRNTSDYRRSPVLAIPPAEFLKAVNP
jgi:hypothetical protein